MPMITHRNQGKNTYSELVLIESLKRHWKCWQQQSRVTAKNPAGKLCGWKEFTLYPSWAFTVTDSWRVLKKIWCGSEAFIFTASATYL